MYWTEVEAALAQHIKAAWALSSQAATPLVFEDPDQSTGRAEDAHVLITFDGTFAQKGIYGGAGKRLSVEGGLVFIHAFVPVVRGKAAATALVDAMVQILELQVVSTVIRLEGADPPSSLSGDPAVPSQQPDGNYFRSSTHVPFIVIGSR